MGARRNGRLSGGLSGRLSGSLSGHPCGPAVEPFVMQQEKDFPLLKIGGKRSRCLDSSQEVNRDMARALGQLACSQDVLGWLGQQHVMGIIYTGAHYVQRSRTELPGSSHVLIGVPQMGV